MRGWIAWRDQTVDEPKIISTRDGGRHWQDVSQQELQTIQMVNDSRGYGKVAEAFFRTNDGGHSWVETKMPNIRFIDRMYFQTPELGWIAGGQGKDFMVYRTINGGQDWEEYRTPTPENPTFVRDLFFLDEMRGWLITHGSVDVSYLYSTVDGGRHWTAEPDLSFQGKGKWASVVRFTSRERGFVFVDEGAQYELMYTLDAGTHWQKQRLPASVYDCQILEGDLLCSSGFRLLTVHPK